MGYAAKIFFDHLPEPKKAVLSLIENSRVESAPTDGARLSVLRPALTMIGVMMIWPALLIGPVAVVVIGSWIAVAIGNYLGVLFGQ